MQAQDLMAVLNGVCRRALLAKAVRVWVGEGFRYWIERDDPDEERVALGAARMRASRDRFEAMLDGRDHLFGDDFSAADCAAFPFLKYGKRRDPDDDELFHRILEDNLRLEDSQASRLHIYIRDDAAGSDILDLETRLEKDPRIASVTYVTKAPMGTIEGRGMLSWDAEKKAYRMDWYDNTGDVVHFTGDFNAEGVLVLSADRTHAGQPIKEQFLIKKQDDGTVLFTSQVAGPDGAMKTTMESLGTRDVKK